MMVREVVSFRLDQAELKLLDTLSQKYKISRSDVLRKILMIFAKNLAMQDELEEELKQEIVKELEKNAIKEIRERGKVLLSKATWRVRMIKFYTKLIEDGVRWDEFKDTFISWIEEAKVHGIDEKTVKDTIEEIAHIYYRTRQDIDMEKGLEEVYKLFLEELEGAK